MSNCFQEHDVSNQSNFFWKESAYSNLWLLMHNQTRKIFATLGITNFYYWKWALGINYLFICPKIYLTSGRVGYRVFLKIYIQDHGSLFRCLALLIHQFGWLMCIDWDMIMNLDSFRCTIGDLDTKRGALIRILRLLMTNRAVNGFHLFISTASFSRAFE